MDEKTKKLIAVSIVGIIVLCISAGTYLYFWHNRQVVHQQAIKANQIIEKGRAETRDLAQRAQPLLDKYKWLKSQGLPDSDPQVIEMANDIGGLIPMLVQDYDGNGNTQLKSIEECQKFLDNLK